MSWEVFRIKHDEKYFTVRGEGFVLHGEVWRGAMKGDTYWGLKALGSPVLASRLLRRWKVAVPRRFAAEDNTGLSRRYVELRPLTSGASFVLRFEEYIPTELLSALKVVFEGAGQTDRKEQNHEEPSRDAVEHPPQGALGRGSRRHVPRQDRNAPRTRQDPRAKGQVARKRAKRS